MGIYNNISRKENVARNMILEHRKPGLRKLVIWGSKALASNMIKYFEANDVIIDGLVVDDIYYEGDSNLLGYDVYKISDYLSKNDKCDIVVAFRGYKEELKKKYESESVKVYAFDFSGMVKLDLLKNAPEIVLKKYESDIIWLESVLEDEKSKEEMRSYIEQMLVGYYSKKVTENQYFCEDIITFCDNEVFVDCGAYNGDSVIAFYNAINKQGKNIAKVYAFEPDSENAIKLRKNTAAILDKIITVIEKGTWSKEDVLHFSEGCTTSSCIDSEGDIEVSVDSIDNVLNGEKATFIKMDIEGSELAALHGARETIMKYKPKLAICIYHKGEDFITIPRYIKELNSEYRLYMRNHDDFMSQEAVIYAI